MNIDVKDRITLSDNNAYFVVSKIEYQGKTYYYLIESSKMESFKFCYEKPETNVLVEVDDVALNRELTYLFANDMKQYINPES